MFFKQCQKRKKVLLDERSFNNINLNIFLRKCVNEFFFSDYFKNGIEKLLKIFFVQLGMGE
jgi:hypothetical protein